MKLKTRGLPLYKDDQVKSTTKKMQNEDVRSHQPVDLRSRWVLGDVTEVLDHSSWRPGKIAEVLKNDYFVIRLTGCIQLKEFHISCLRVPPAYRSKQLTVTERVSELLSKPIRPADRSSHYSKFVMGQDCQMYEDDHSSKRKAAKICASTSSRIVKRKLEPSRRPPKSLVKITSKKQKASAYKVLQPTKKVLPLKVSGRTNIDASHFYRPLSHECNDLAKNNMMEGKPDREVLPSSDVPLHDREENECSVASCSANYLEYCTSDDQQSVRIGDCFPDDVMSTCPPISGEEHKNVYDSGLHMDVHELELQAYQSTVRAFHAAGPLTWEQESLLTNLRLSLNISNEEHLLQLRHLLSS